MSEQKITVALTEAQLRSMHHLALAAAEDCADVLGAALLPKYPVGLYRVTSWRGAGQLAFRTETDAAELWCVLDGKDTRGLMDSEVVKVEPLRVLADDEVAVKRVTFAARPGTTIQSLRTLAGAARGECRHTAAAIVDAYADALDAETQP